MMSTHFLPVLQAFSEEFECIFVPGTSLGPTCEQLVKMLRKDASVTSEVFLWVKDYIQALDGNGACI